MDLGAPVGIPSPFSTFQIFVSRVMMPEFIVPIVLLNECALLASGLFLEGIIFVLPLCFGTLSMPASHSALRFTYCIDPSMTAAESLTGAAL